MNNNKIVIFISVIAFALIITIPTLININTKHKDNIYKSITLKIEESAKKCVIEEKCKGDKIFIKELYDKKYLEKQINPYNKKYINENSYVTKKGNKYKFIETE
jgi:hypothetical protein